MSAKPVRNFGRNVEFQPDVVAAPKSEAELLDVLAANRDRRIRAIGRMHSWSEAARADEVLLDLRHLNTIVLERTDTGCRATIGAGCQINQILAELAWHGLTLPSVGLISEQTIAGATATGTHGSGKNSLSHYLTSVRIANYDPQSGQPVIRTIRDGDELRAARCAIGCLGVVVSVELVPREPYQIREWFTRHDSLHSVLAAESTSPLQQFFFVPWRWDFMVQHRQETNEPRGWLAPLYRAYWFAAIDLGLHLMLKLFVQILGGRGLKPFFRWIVPLTVIRNWRVVDRSQDMLVMEHELFVHIETELFVRREHLPAALDFTREVIEAFDGNLSAISPATQTKLAELGLLDELRAAQGAYRHHYPICVRRVLPDDTLLSMSSGGKEDWYAISFISYASPNQRSGFERCARFLGRAMLDLFAARPHWGKIASLTRAEVDRLYPDAERFRELRRQCDPSGVFQNRWTGELLG